MINIKVCGINQLKQLQQLEAMNIDFAGLIFYPESPRFVGDKLNKKEIKSADFDLKKVGVFVNPDLIDVLDAIDDRNIICNLFTVLRCFISMQLHHIQTVFIYRLHQIIIRFIYKHTHFGNLPFYLFHFLRRNFYAAYTAVTSDKK